MIVDNVDRAIPFIASATRRQVTPEVEDACEEDDGQERGIRVRREAVRATIKLDRRE
jgi:hypothetical protein